VSYYTELEIEHTATQDEIKRAYFKLARKHTPDKDPVAFMRIRQAYETLFETGKRAAYDEELSRVLHLPENAASLILEAERMIEKNLYGDSISMLERELNAFKKDEAAFDAIQFVLGKSYMESGKTGKAVKIAEKLAKKYPENVDYVKFAVTACDERGWTNKSQEYKSMLDHLSHGDELFYIDYIDRNPTEITPDKIGEMIVDVEKNGKKAPLLCMVAFSQRFLIKGLASMIEDMSGASGLDFSKLGVGELDSGSQWNKVEFLAQKLVEHTVGVEASKKGELRHFLVNSILTLIHARESYSLLPYIDTTIQNLGLEDIFDTIQYKINLFCYEALLAVEAGLPKALAAIAVLKYCSECELFDKDEKQEFLESMASFELAILMQRVWYKPHFTRFKNDFQKMYKQVAKFVDSTIKYSDNKVLDEINRRMTRLIGVDYFFTLDWLGEDDDFGIAPETDIVFVEESSMRPVSRNAPCPCGSGKKYKRCCGK